MGLWEESTLVLELFRNCEEFRSSLTLRVEVNVWGWRVTSVGQVPPCKHEDPGLIPSTHVKKQSMLISTTLGRQRWGSQEH